MRAILILVAGGGLVGCGANVCDRMDQLRTECNATPADADVAACRRTIRDCDGDQVDLLDGYLDCLVEGVEDGVDGKRSPDRNALARNDPDVAWLGVAEVLDRHAADPLRRHPARRVDAQPADLVVRVGRREPLQFGV
ncbi:MAG: hypothetical protein AAF211_11665, partial [Myxococcota bacterium]